MALQKDLTEPQVDLRSVDKIQKEKLERIKNEELKIKNEELRMKNEKQDDKIVEEKIEKIEASVEFIKEAPMVPEGIYDFPTDFLWGTSTSAYQVEGGIKNDWSEWEVSEKRLAELGKKGEDKKDFICGQAVDHYKRYEEDLDLAKNLNNNAIRIGLEWARIQPKKDTWDVTAINHYREVLNRAHAKGLKTVVTLWHWTNPIWLTNEKGWEDKKVQEYFGNYVDFVIEELGSEVDYWVTLNEPILAANYGFMTGCFPPKKRNIFKFIKVSRNLIAAHKLAYQRIHKHFPRARVSITNLSNCFLPNKKALPMDILFSKLVEWVGHDMFFDRCKKHIDFVGVDYYRKIYISFIPPFMRSKSDYLTDMGWEMYPEGIYVLLKKFSKYKKPIIILENGLADANDKYRANFLIEHLYYIHKAIKEGVDVQGYFHWSLLDNFEWDKGYYPKFGLYEVDRKTFERKERPSAEVYRKICEENKLVVN